MTMSSEDEKEGSVALASPEDEAIRLKTSAEETYTSGDLKSALKLAKRAHKLHPSLDGLPEMITAFKILRTAAAPPAFENASESQTSATPDYYGILQAERFSHPNTIRKQYKKLALALHPDKNSFAASAEAFKLVGEAAQVLTDKIRRKEYDMRLRIAMQSKAAEEVGLGAEETFSTACSACQLLHQFERKYMGHNLVCPGCKKSFKAMEVKEDTNNGVRLDNSQVRVSARIREKVTKGGSLGIVERCGLGVKRKVRSIGEVLERSEMKVARNMSGDGVLLKDLKLKRVNKVEKLGECGGGGGEGFRSKKVEKLVNGETSKGNELRMRRVSDEVEKESNSGVVEIVESDRTKEDNMTLSQMKVLIKKEKKQVEGKMMMEENNSEKLKAKENEGENDKEEEKAVEKEKVEKTKEEMAHSTLKTYRRRYPKNRSVEIINKTVQIPLHTEMEGARLSKEDNLEMLLEGTERDVGGGKENEKEMEDKREKRVRRRVSKYGNFEVVKREKSKNHADLEIERLITKKKGNLEIMPVEDSDFHDFDKNRKGRNFKKGQVWALYDDDDGMPRHYALVDEIVSINPFEVTLCWLLFQINGDEELMSRRKMGFHVSCGSFKVSRKVSIKYLNLFSHVVGCERATREVYRVYPTKGSVWALYRHNTLNAEKTSQSVNNNKFYDIVICLSSYSDMHGLSIGHLEKVPGFRTIFKRKAVGANAVIYLGKNDVKLFSHQIPAHKLSGEEASGLPKDCWELDPASLTPQLLNET